MGPANLKQQTESMIVHRDIVLLHVVLYFTGNPPDKGAVPGCRGEGHDRGMVVRVNGRQTVLVVRDEGDEEL